MDGKNIYDLLTQKPIIIAGPCSVESKDQIEKVAEYVSKLGIKFLRGGAYKPRTSPDSFQGMGLEGAKLLKSAAEKYGLYTVSEVLTIDDLKESYNYIDIIQVGSRNMASYGLLKQIAELNKDDKKPLILKRHFAATITEFLKASDYLAHYGNNNIILCLRGIRTFEQIDSSLRFTPDLGAILDLKEKTDYPIVFDPSHPAGERKYVSSLSRAAMEIGADGLMIEIHPNPDAALSDKDQAMFLDDFGELMRNINSNHN